MNQKKMILNIYEINGKIIMNEIASDPLTRVAYICMQGISDPLHHNYGPEILQ